MKVSIIGFGFTGLTAAWSFLRAGHEVHVYEKDSKIGGLLQTQSTEFGLVESSANAILRSENVSLMASDFNVEWAIRKKTSKLKWVHTDKPRRWPLTVKETLSYIKPMYMLAKGKSSIKPLPLETVKEWGQRVFKSEAFVDKLLGPALQGVYANSSDNLSAQLCLNSFFSKQKIKHDGSYAPKFGMSEFFNKGLLYLKKHNNFSLNLNDIKQYENIDSDLILDTTPDYLNVDYLGVYSVTLFLKTEDRPQFQGFGCLFAKSKTVLGVLFNSDIFENRSVDGVFSETWIVSDLAFSESNVRSNKEFNDLKIIDYVLKFREKIWNLDTKPIFSSANYWPKGIPNYSIKHEIFLQNNFKFENNTKKNKVIRLGNYTGDIGLNKILEGNVRLAKSF